MNAMMDDEERELAATAAHCGEMIGAVLFHIDRGMSRKRLIGIYGRDLVDLALAQRAKKR